MDGIIALWKERGMTSHDCVFKLRKILQTKKIGHGGTLDPDVDGVLPIAVGKGTKTIEYLQTHDKQYTGEITLGFSTTTEDISGEKVEVTPILAPLSEEEVDHVMATFIGTITQVPPMYSAVRVNGKRLYEYAREGLPVERPKRQTTISHFERISPLVYNKENQTLSWRFNVTCSKGTYVRTLAVDTGKALGVAAHMSDLTRLASGGLTADKSFRLQDIQTMVEQDDSSFLLPIELAFEQFQQINLDAERYEDVRNGRFLSVSDYPSISLSAPVACYYHEKIVAIYQQHPTKSDWLKPVKVLRINE